MKRIEYLRQKYPNFISIFIGTGKKAKKFYAWLEEELQSSLGSVKK